MHQVVAAVLLTAPLVGVLSKATPAQTELRPSSTCIALTLPSVAGVDGSATSFATAVRDLFVSFLTGPGIKIVQLESRLPSQAALESREKGCGEILLATVTRKRSTGNGFGALVGRTAGIAAARTPVGAGVAGTIAGSATSAVGEAIYRLASQTRAKDEIELSYRLGTPETVPTVAPISAKAKARADGEDLLTGLVERAAAGILATVTGEGRR
jgi:hypothetical protein